MAPSEALDIVVLGLGSAVGTELSVSGEHQLPHHGSLLTTGENWEQRWLGGSAASDAECEEVLKWNVSQQCHFVRTTDDCQTDEGIINYTEVIYCTFTGYIMPLGAIILVLWWLTLFIALAVTADKFFCPSLVVIAKTLRMSDNIAGVTLLAFGNGAPDVFSAIAAVRTMKKGNAGLAVGALVGAGVFVTTVVAGSVAMVMPFHAMERPFLRDIIFYLTAVFMTFYVLYTNVITLPQAIAFIGVYVVYVIVVIMGRYCYQRQKEKEQFAQGILNGSRDNALSDSDNSGSDDDTSVYAPGEVVNRDPDVEGTYTHTLRAHTPHDEDMLTELSPLVRSISNNMTTDPVSPAREFLLVVCPVVIAKWSQMKWYERIYGVFKTPVELVLLMTVPIVDLTVENNTWNRHLNSIHCITAPLTVLFFAHRHATAYEIGGVFPMWALVLLLGIALAVIVYSTSTNSTPPIYHRAFAFLGFITAVFWISAIANEIVNLLQTFGIMFSISKAILGLTFLAWGNSLGDLVADTTMAKQGLPRTGISACFGGPMFNLVIGMGVPFTIKTVKNGGSVELDFTVIQVLLLAGLAASLISSLIILPLIRFNLNRIYAAYLYTLYVVFLILAILIETEVIKGHV